MQYFRDLKHTTSSFSSLPSFSSPFFVLAAAIISQSCIGSNYWWPALAPGLAGFLSLSNTQSTTLVAAVNAGSLFAIVAGLFHDRYGSRVTALYGAIGTSLTFFLFFLACLFPPRFLAALYFPTFIVLAFCCRVFLYMVYAASVSASAAAFPPKFRGRVVGMNAAMFGASAGILTSVQAALFPDLDETPQMLVLVTGVSVVPALLAYCFYPRASSPDGESAPLLAGRHEIPEAVVVVGLRRMYFVAAMIVVLLPLAAVAELLTAPRLLLTLLAALVVVCVASFGIVAFFARPEALCEPTAVDAVAEAVDEGPEEQESAELALLEVARDMRAHYLALGFTVVVAGGGIAVLVQASALAAALVPVSAPAPTIGNGEVSPGNFVRPLVILFSAGNIAGRLLIGSIMDRGATALRRHLLKYHILHYNCLVMACGMLAVALNARIVTLVAVNIIGWAYGTFFSVSPALVSIWFGVRSFPRNFSVLHAFEAIGVFTISTSLPAFLRRAFGTWVDVRDVASSSAQSCRGIACTFPAFALLASFQVAMFLLGFALRSQVRSKAVALGA